MNALPLAGAVLGVVVFSQSGPPAGQVPPDVQANETNLARLAIEAGSQGDIAPIPLVANGQRYGWIYDRFLLGAVAARAVIASGTTPNAEAPPGQGIVPLRIAIVAEPLTCDGRTNPPVDVHVDMATGPAPGPARRTAPNAKGAAADTILPGIKLAENALVASFIPVPWNGSTTVRIDYDSPACPNSSNTVAFSPRLALARPPGPLTQKFPDGVSGLPSPAVVRVRVVIDPHGKPRFATRVDGDPVLEPAAVAAVEQLALEPARLNGVAVPINLIVPVTFTTTAATAAPTPMASTTIGGRLPGASTPDVPNLTAATSKCAISDDDAYGYSPERPIKVDGGARDGPARERRYLSALRGPNGEGLQYRRLGSTLGPDKTTILDMYEITYGASGKTIRLFVDEYHSEDLKAPKGFVCAVPFDLK
ncbi:MAG: energy transducer TonB [Acidobacteriota bacterium]